MKRRMVYLIALIALSCSRKDKVEPEAEEPMYIYVNSLSGSTYALDARTGETVWKFDESSQLEEPSSPTIVEKVVYITGRDALYALDALTGAVIWESSPVRFGSTTPTVEDGTVYVGTLDRMLYALDIKTGEKKWEFESSYIVCAPTVINDEVYFSDTNGILHCLDKNTGQLKWKTSDHGGTYRSNPIYYNNSILAGLNYTFVSLNAKTGELNWRFQSDGEVLSSPVIYNDKVFFGSEYSYSVFSVDINTGKKIWSLKSTGNSQAFSSPYIKNDTLFMGFINGRFYALNALNGNVHWEINVGERIGYASPVAAGGSVFLPAGGTLFCLNSKDGSGKWSIKPGAPFSSPAILLKNGKAKHAAPGGQED